MSHLFDSMLLNHFLVKTLKMRYSFPEDGDIYTESYHKYEKMDIFDDDRLTYGFFKESSPYQIHGISTKKSEKT